MATSKRKPQKKELATHTMTHSNGFGNIQISEDVIAAVVKSYTLSVPGVARLAGTSIVGGLAEMFGKRGHDRGLRVEFEEDNKVCITVHIIIKFGEHVPSVATNVQNVCHKYIEELTGQQVSSVNVIVQNLDSEEESEEEVEKTDDEK